MADLAAEPTLPLAGLRVLDCSRVLAGPYATMVLGDLGADVIKLEPPIGDETRTWGPPFWGDPAEGRSAYFSAVNRNKRSIVVNLKADEGRQIFDALAAKAHVLVHNFRPTTADRLGLGARRLQEVHPHLIVSAVGGFPGGDFNRDLPAYDLLAQAMSGLMSVTGEPHGEPMKVGVALLDLVAGQNIAIGILATLVGGSAARPQLVATQLIEVGVTSLLNVLANYLASGKEQIRYGNAHANIAPYQSFRTADGYVVIAVGNDAQFDRLLDTLGLEDAAGRFATNPDRLAHRPELADWLGEAIASWSRDELVQALGAADVPAGPVLSVGEAVDAIQAAHAGEWLEELGGIRLAPSPILINGQRTPARIAPPRFGEHTQEVLKEIGCDQTTIDAYLKAGVVR